MGNRSKGLLIDIVKISRICLKEINDIRPLIIYEIFVFSVLFGGSKMQNDNLIFIINMFNFLKSNYDNLSFLLLFSQHFFNFYRRICIKSIKWAI